MRKRGHPPISSVAPDSMAPWEGSSHSESSFTSFPPPLSPLPLAHSKPITAPDPPLPPPPPSQISQIKNIEPENGQSARVKRKPLPPRHPSRPPRLPPLRQVTNLSFSRSFTFSFFELPVHQSARSRVERLRDLTVLLRQFQYWGKTCYCKFTSGAENYVCKFTPCSILPGYGMTSHQHNSIFRLRVMLDTFLAFYPVCGAHFCCCTEG